jgi:hypothetical protein
MEKQEKVLWRYAIATLALVELVVYLLFMQQPIIWDLARAVFALVNIIVTAELIHIQVQVNRYNTEHAGEDQHAELLRPQASVRARSTGVMIERADAAHAHGLTPAVVAEA